jgi:hypothetical protein
MGLDKIERSVGFVAGGLAIVLALIISPHLFKNTWVTDTAKPSSTHTCPTLYHLVHGVCTYKHLTHPSDWLAQFLEILVLGIGALAFAWWRKRAGVSVATLLLGLALGVVGLPFLFVGGWLIIRALRLQKYGDATFSGSSRRAREMAGAKKAARKSGASAAPSSPPGTASPPPPPTASKRYTPKQRPRRR